MDYLSGILLFLLYLSFWAHQGSSSQTTWCNREPYPLSGFSWIRQLDLDPPKKNLSLINPVILIIINIILILTYGTSGRAGHGAMWIWTRHHNNSKDLQFTFAKRTIMITSKNCCIFSLYSLRKQWMWIFQIHLHFHFFFTIFTFMPQNSERTRTQPFF